MWQRFIANMRLFPNWFKGYMRKHFLHILVFGVPAFYGSYSFYRDHLYKLYEDSLIENIVLTDREREFYTTVLQEVYEIDPSSVEDGLLKRMKYDAILQLKQYKIKNINRDFDNILYKGSSAESPLAKVVLKPLDSNLVKGNKQTPREPEL